MQFEIAPQKTKTKNTNKQQQIKMQFDVASTKNKKSGSAASRYRSFYDKQINQSLAAKRNCPDG